MRLIIDLDPAGHTNAEIAGILHGVASSIGEGLLPLDEPLDMPLWVEGRPKIGEFRLART